MMNYRTEAGVSHKGPYVNLQTPLLPGARRIQDKISGPAVRSETRGLAVNLDVPSIQCSVNMTEIYDRVLLS
jgi:hypothetical protein